MADDQVEELTAYQRSACVMLELARGRRLRTEDVMQLTGLRRSGALKLLGQLCQLHSAAVYEDRGWWRLMSYDDRD